MSQILFVVGLKREAQILERGAHHDVRPLHPLRGSPSPASQGRITIIVGTAGLHAALAARPSALISFGLCGGLDPILKVGDLIIATSVVDENTVWKTDVALSARLAAALPHARHGSVVGSEVILGSPSAKAALHERSGAGIVDMESHHIGAAAAKAGIPFAVVRAISDAAGDTLPQAAQAGFRPDGTTDVRAVVGALLARPWDLPPLLRTATHAGAAFRTLARAAPGLKNLG